MLDWQRVHARLYDLVQAPAERSWLGALRRELLARAQGVVVEIGAGTGANLAHYDHIESVTLTEPDGGMRGRLARRLAETRVPVDICPAGAERLPYDDGRFDTAVSTLVMCTVPEPRRALAEIRRVLRKGGRFLFLEHGGAAGRRGVWQRRCTPVWSRIAGGCDLTRDAVSLIESAGFAIDELRTIEPKRTPPFVRPFRMGVATTP